MKRTAHIVMALAFCGAACAASVPQTSADTYYFSRPNLPSNIVGRVMGDPPAYHVMRSEDVAWLREAYAERAALAGDYWPDEWDGLPRIGVDSARIGEVSLWPDAGLLANTNRLELGYLSTNDAEYVSAARAWRSDDPDWRGSSWTSVTVRTRLVPAWSNRTSIITMPMTNGTTSVWTNAWSVFAPTGATVCETNVVTRGTSLVCCIFTNRVVEGYGKLPPSPLRGPYDSAALTNHYAFLRGLRRLARTPTPAPGAGIPKAWRYYWDSTDDWDQSHYNSDIATTNDGDTVSMPYVDVSGSRMEKKEYHYDYGSGTWEVGTTVDRGFSGYRAVGIMSYRLPAPRHAAIPDGTTHCVGRARLYALVEASYYEAADARTNGFDYTEHYVSSFSTNISWTCVVPVGDVSVGIDAGTNLCFTADFGGVLESAWAATDAPNGLPAGDEFPALRYICPAPAYDAGTGETGAAWTQAHRDYEARVQYLLLLIDFAPRTTLPGWN